MNIVTERVDSAGPPPVSRYGSSKIWAAPMKEVTTTKAVTGFSAGRVTVVKVRRRPAPSSAAASYNSLARPGVRRGRRR